GRKARGHRPVQQVDAVERGVVHDRSDLVADRGEVLVQRVAGGGGQRGVGGGERLFLQLQEQIGNRLTGGQRDVHGRLAALQAVLHGVQGADLGALALGDSPDSAV